MKRFGAVVVLITAMIAGSGWMVAASAAPGVTTMTFTTPSSNGATITANPVTLAGQVSHPGGSITSVDITVKWTDTVAGRPSAPHPPHELLLTPPAHASTFTWSDTVDLGANGQYTVGVAAVADDGPGTPTNQTNASEVFVLDVKPATPTNLTDTVNQSSRTTTLKWSANTEADLIGYEILRAGPTSTSPSQVIYGVNAPNTTYTDTEVAYEPAGTYRYQIAAVRPNGAGNGADVSDPSTEADATYTSAPKPPPTTTTVAGPPGTTPGGGGTGSGGTGSGGATGSNPSSGGSGIVIAPAGPGLGGYQSLQDAVGRATATTVAPEVDNGFNPKLPYQPQTGQHAISLPGDLVGAGPLGSSTTSGVARTFEFLAAALLLGVLAMFGLVLRRAADQGLLDPIAPIASGEVDVPVDALLLTIFPQNSSSHTVRPIHEN